MSIIFYSQLCTVLIVNIVSSCTVPNLAICTCCIVLCLRLCIYVRIQDWLTTCRWYGQHDNHVFFFLVLLQACVIKGIRETLKCWYSLTSCTIHRLDHCIEMTLFHFICSVGEPVELSSKFIRYSTFKTGKEQLVGVHTHIHTIHTHTVIHTLMHIHVHIFHDMPKTLAPPTAVSHDHSSSTHPPIHMCMQVNCGTLESLLERLVKVSHYGLDFLNTFLMTFPLYTTADHVLDFLSKSYHDCLSTRERKRSGSITPQDAVRDARGMGGELCVCVCVCVCRDGEEMWNRKLILYPGDGEIDFFHTENKCSKRGRLNALSEGYIVWVCFCVWALSYWNNAFLNIIFDSTLYIFRDSHAASLFDCLPYWLCGCDIRLSPDHPSAQWRPRPSCPHQNSIRV